MLIGSLPAGLEEPLHLLEPWPWKRLIAVAVLCLVLAFLVWRRGRAEQRREPKALEPASVPQPSSSGLAAAVADLRRRQVEHGGDFRRACHELAGLAREHFEKLRGRPYTVLTAGEIRREEGDTPFSRLFELLTSIQFGRSRPSQEDFEGACELVLEEADRS